MALGTNGTLSINYTLLHKVNLTMLKIQKPLRYKYSGYKENYLARIENFKINASFGFIYKIRGVVLIIIFS